MKTIGILVTGHAPDSLRLLHGDYADMFVALLGEHDFHFRRFNVIDGDFPESPDVADGWMVTGSKHGVYEALDWIGRLESFIRDAHTANVPMVGICFGHQVMAKAMGGTVEKFAGGWTVGTCRYRRHDTGATMAALAFHQDQVIEAPPMAETFGEGETCRHAMLRYGDWGLSYQPHPEFTSGFFTALAENHRDVLPETVYGAALPVTETLATQAMREEIRAFLDRN